MYTIPYIEHGETFELTPTTILPSYQHPLPRDPQPSCQRATHLYGPRDILIQTHWQSTGPVRHLEGLDVLWFLPGSPALHDYSLYTRWDNQVNLQPSQSQIFTQCF